MIRTSPAAIALLPSSDRDTVKIPTNEISPWLELFSILKKFRRLPQTFTFLLAWFVMSDAFATITSTAILFAKTTLGMKAQELVWVGVLTPLAGIIGALAWPKLQHGWLKTTDLQTLRIIVALAVLVRPAELYSSQCNLRLSLHGTSCRSRCGVY